MVVLKYSNAINCYTSINLTKLDILDGLKELKIAIAYKRDGELMESFPGKYSLFLNQTCWIMC